MSKGARQALLWLVCCTEPFFVAKMHGCKRTRFQAMRRRTCF
jgi:hypothetical protein